MDFTPLFYWPIKNLVYVLTFDWHTTFFMIVSYEYNFLNFPPAKALAIVQKMYVVSQWTHFSGIRIFSQIPSDIRRSDFSTRFRRKIIRFASDIILRLEDKAQWSKRSTFLSSANLNKCPVFGGPKKNTANRVSDEFNIRKVKRKRVQIN